MSKTMKKLLSFVIVAVMILSMIPAVYADETEAATETKEAWTPNPTQTYEAEEWFEVSTAEELVGYMAGVSSKYPNSLNGEENEGRTFGIRLTADIALEVNKDVRYAVLYVGRYIDATDTTPSSSYGVNYVIDLGGHTLTDTSTNARLFGVYGGSDLVITNGTLEARGVYYSTGGVLFCQGECDITLDGVQIIANSGCKSGTDINGGVGNISGDLTVKNSRVEVYETTYTSGTYKNRTQLGGMFYIGAAIDVTLENSTFVGGYAKDGAQLNVGYGANVNATDCTFECGVATRYGGSISAAATNGQINLTRCTFTGGQASSGGQIRLGATIPMNAVDCTFTGGTAETAGNIYIANTNVKTKAPNHVFTRCTISNGTATNGGGGNVYQKNNSTYWPDQVLFKDCTITGGDATTVEKKFGGNIYACGLSLTTGGVTYYPTITIDGGTVSDGKAGYGGNLGSASAGRYVLTGGVQIFDGEAGVWGGNLYTGNEAASVYLYDATFTGGTAGSSAGNVRINAGKLYMYGGTITGGTASGTNTKLFYVNSSGKAYIYGGTFQHTSSSNVYSGSNQIFFYNGTTIGFGMTSCVVEGHSSYTKLTGTPTTYVYTHDDLDGAENNIPATCTAEGKTVVDCAECKQTFEYAVPATGHIAGEAVRENEVENTCAAEGSYDSVVYCSVCNVEMSRETITVAAAAHTAGEPVIENEVASSCTAEGSYETVVYCTVCETEISRETTTVPAAEHTASEAVIENEIANSCTADGSYDTVVYCTVCNAEISRETTTVAAAGHTEVTDAAVAATCTETGLTEGKHCETCGAVTLAQEIVPALGHTEVIDTAVAATCTESGLTEGKHCSVCGTVTVAQETVDALGHTAGEAARENEVAATCTADGSYETAVYCSVCSVELSRETTTVAAIGHNYEATYTAPTFEADGYTTYTCANCGDSYTVTDEGSKKTAVATADGVSYETLQEALTAGGEVVLLQDITATDKLTAAATATLDLGGYNLTLAGVEGNYALIVKGDLTIAGNGTIIAPGGYGIGVSTTGKLTVNGGNFFATEINDYIIGNWGEVTINDGFFWGMYNVLNTFAEGSGTATITGGQFMTDDTDYTGNYESEVILGINTTVTGGQFTKLASEYVADNYAYITTGEVVKLAEVIADDIVTLESDVTMTEKLVVSGTTILDLNGHTLTLADLGYNYGLVVTGNLKIVGNGTIVAPGGFGIGVNASGYLTIENGTYIAGQYNDYIVGNYGTTVINDGTFVGVYNCVNNFQGITKIYGGTYTTQATDYTGEYESEDILADAGLTVYGGTFSKPVAAEFCAEGLCPAENEDGTYTVAEKPPVVENAITLQPQSINAETGTDVQFHVEVQGDVVSYKWEYRKISKWYNTTMTGFDTDTLTVGAKGSRHGYDYRCTITFADGTVLVSEPAELTVNTYINITSNPSDQTVVNGYKGQFTVKAEGEDLKYRWYYQRPDGTIWMETDMEGNTKQTVMIESAGFRNGYKYKCKITDAAGVETWSEVATMRVLTVTEHPAEAFALNGTKVTFTIETSVPDGFTYQWQYSKNGGESWSNTSMTGYNTATLTVDATASRNGYLYRCELTGSKSSKLQSKAAVLHCGDALTIIEQPTNVTAAASENAVFHVEVANAYSFQWKYNKTGNTWSNTSATGFDTDTLTVAAKGKNGYKYRCHIKGLDGTEIVTDEVTLTVG